MCKSPLRLGHAGCGRLARRCASAVFQFVAFEHANAGCGGTALVFGLCFGEQPLLLQPPIGCMQRLNDGKLFDGLQERQEFDLLRNSSGRSSKCLDQISLL